MCAYWVDAMTVYVSINKSGRVLSIWFLFLGANMIPGLSMLNMRLHLPCWIWSRNYKLSGLFDDLAHLHQQLCSTLNLTIFIVLSTLLIDNFFCLHYTVWTEMYKNYIAFTTDRQNYFSTLSILVIHLTHLPSTLLTHTYIFSIHKIYFFWLIFQAFLAG